MEHSFHHLIMAEHSIFQKKLLAMLKDTGLTIGQPKILDYLWSHDGTSQKDIARGCHIEPGTLTTLLNRMEENHLVERRMRKGNRKNSYVFLTDAGKAQAELVADIFHTLESEAFHGISYEERSRFMDTLLHIYQNITL